MYSGVGRDEMFSSSSMIHKNENLGEIPTARVEDKHAKAPFSKKGRNVNALPVQE